MATEGTIVQLEMDMGMAVPQDLHTAMEPQIRSKLQSLWTIGPSTNGQLGA